jgi:hypothetical protein
MLAFLDTGCDSDTRFVSHELNCALRQEFPDCAGSFMTYAKSIRPLPQGPLIFRFCEKHKTSIPSWMKKLSNEEAIIIDVITT